MDDGSTISRRAEPELSRPVSLDRIAVRGTSLVVEADGAELAPIASRLGVPAVGTVRCRWAFREPTGLTQVIDADGVLDAVVSRICVVTLEAFDEIVHEAFSVRFVPAGTESGSDDEDPDTPDLLPYAGSSIDLGEATVEQLALALDPFPRAPGAVLDRVIGVDSEDGEADGANPFARLGERLRRD